MSFVERLANNAFFRLSITLALAAGVIVGRRQVSERFIKGPLVADDIFDNTASNEVIGNVPIEKIPQGQIDKLFPDAFGKLNDGKIPYNLSTL
jgi:hypothetical protein